MKTTEVISLLKTHDVDKTLAYNILIEDIWNIKLVTKPTDGLQEAEVRPITVEDMARPEAQALIAYFMYQIQEVLLPVIADLRQPVKPDLLVAKDR